ncbi:MAG: response regulator [Holosporales bacterium]|nr:response regulator [Holosporales bacterium]
MVFLAYALGAGCIAKYSVPFILCTVAVCCAAALCAVVSCRFLAKFRLLYQKSTLARSFLSILSEADEVIIVDQDANIVYAKYISPEERGKPLDFAAFIQDQFVCSGTVLKRCKRAISDGVYFEDVFKTATTPWNNHENYVLVRVLPVYTQKNHSPTHRAIIMGDITMYRKSAQEPHDWTMDINSAVKDAPFGMVCVDPAGAITWHSDIVAQLFGQQDDLLYGKNIREFIDVPNLPDAPAIHSESLKAPIPVQIKKRTKDCLSIVSYNIRTAEDRTIIIIFEKDFLQKLLEACNGRDFLRNIPIPSMHISNNGVVLHMSDSAKCIFKAVKTGGNFFEILEESSKNQLTRAMQFWNKNTGQSFDLDVLGGDLSFSTYIKKIEYGNSFILQMIDTTEQKKIEQQFYQAQKIQAVGQLAGGIAHDFNNLLTAIIGFCDLLLQRIMPNDPSYADIMQIKQNSNRASTLVKQLLAFSRRQSLQPRIINIKNILTEISSLLRRLIGSQINFRVINEKNLWSIKADISQLEQVIINIVVNARDAMDGKGDLTIETSNYTNSLQQSVGNDVLLPGDYVLIKISDSGCGISSDLIPSIFDPFFSTKELGQGTGLGLAMVYGIVKQTGGAIGVESKVGNGTVFSVYLPRCYDEDIAVEKRNPVITDVTGNETILLVEDEEAIRIFAGRALRDKGYRVIEAANGEIALSLIESLIEQGNIPDILITDVSMPKMDGPALQTAVRQHIPNIPVIFTSGYAEETFRQNLSQDQTICFLPKPFTIRELASKVREIISTS